MKFEAPNPFLPPRGARVDQRQLVEGTLGSLGAEVLDLLSEDMVEATDPVLPPAPISSDDIALTASEERQRRERLLVQELYEREGKRLQEFFGHAISIDPLPPGVTAERIEDWRAQGFELHFLPKTRDILQPDGTFKPFPGWERPPTYAGGAAMGVEKENIHSSSFVLKQNWVLWDTRPLPSDAEEPPLYRQDIFGETLKELRRRKIISSSKYRSQGSGPVSDPTTRFSVSPKELQDPKLRRACANVLGVPEEALHLPTHIENSIIYAIHGEPAAPLSGSRAREWFSDTYHPYPGIRQALSGSPHIHIGASDEESHIPSIGFRFLIRLSAKGVPFIKKEGATS